MGYGILEKIDSVGWLGLPVSVVLFYHDLHEGPASLFWGDLEWYNGIV
jgi:hypothetical protein